jgi:hypothetical protein
MLVWFGLGSQRLCFALVAMLWNWLVDVEAGRRNDQDEGAKQAV